MFDMLTFLGTSDAQGVPRMMCDCPVCTSYDPIHKRRRSSVLFASEGSVMLLDVSPDFREQFLQYGNKRIPDTVLITHCHNDHIGGFGDFGDLCFWNKRHCQVISPTTNIELLHARFPYLLKRRGIEYIAADVWQRGKWQISFHTVNHGQNGHSCGIRFQSTGCTWAYVPDSFGMDDGQLRSFVGCDLLVLGTSYYKEKAERSRRSVYDVSEAIELKKQLGITQLVLTHLSHDIDIPQHSKTLPPGIRFAHDGLSLPLPYSS